jgi:hypothetical protein
MDIMGVRHRDRRALPAGSEMIEKDVSLAN